MTGILRLQLISFISRIMAMAIGIFQSLIIVNLLTKEQFGVIGLVASIAGIAGITQHLGLASSSTKEISQSKDDQEIFDVILSSLSIRLLISIPVSLILLVFAKPIALYYGNLEIILPLQIFGIITLVQAFQSIFNSVISGTQKFKLLFSYQVLIALVSLFIFLPFVYYKNLLGYFYALLIFNTLQSVLLGYFAFRDLNFKIKFPSKANFINLCIKLLKVSLAIYFVKIIFTAWQEVPVAYLGKVVSLESLALFTFAFNLSSKLMAISDSVTDVNLPVFSKKSVESLDDYKNTFLKNFNLLYYFIFICGISVAFWSKEILIGADYFIYFVGYLVGIGFDKNIYDRYSDSIVLFLPLLLSNIFYSFVNIYKSSFFVPLEKLKTMIFTYTLMIFATGLSYYLIFPRFNEILSMSISVFIGSFLSFLLSSFYLQNSLKLNFIDARKSLFALFSIFIGLVSFFISPDFYSKLVIFTFYIMMVFYLFKVNLLSLVKAKK